MMILRMMMIIFQTWKPSSLLLVHLGISSSVLRYNNTISGIIILYPVLSLLFLFFSSATIMSGVPVAGPGVCQVVIMIMMVIMMVIMMMIIMMIMIMIMIEIVIVILMND